MLLFVDLGSESTTVPQKTNLGALISLLLDFQINVERVKSLIKIITTVY